jgi:putative oxidoreductase
MQLLEKLKPLALLFLRLSLGVIFGYSGYQKLFVSMAATLADFQRMGLPPYLAYAAGVLELFGAVLLILGLLTRMTALLLAVEVGIGLFKVHIPQSGIYAVPNYQYPLVLCAAAFGLATFGAGLLSVDAATFERTRAGKVRPKSKS